MECNPWDLEVAFGSASLKNPCRSVAAWPLAWADKKMTAKKGRSTVIQARYAVRPAVHRGTLRQPRAPFRSYSTALP
jgi:hypothetical protein